MHIRVFIVSVIYPFSVDQRRLFSVAVPLVNALRRSVSSLLPPVRAQPQLVSYLFCGMELSAVQDLLTV